MTHCCPTSVHEASKAARLAQMRATHGYEPSTDADVQHDLDAEAAMGGPLVSTAVAIGRLLLDGSTTGVTLTPVEESELRAYLDARGATLTYDDETGRYSAVSQKEMNMTNARFTEFDTSVLPIWHGEDWLAALTARAESDETWRRARERESDIAKNKDDAERTR